ncbi:MAG: FHA domain-containing protein [Anaerolineales bacterium]|nr:MAG: FHA domain-containing protein [Anaerolineales bacterium]
MNCPTCGQAVLTGTRFCGNCGTELASEVEEDEEEQRPPLPDTGTILDSEPVPYLLVTTGPGRGQTFELRGEVRIGRSRTSAITLTDGKVSRSHARLDPVRTTYILTDLGSANGTFVNGVRITQPVRLRDGDSLQFGDTQLVFHTLPSPHSPQADQVAGYPPPSTPAARPRPAPSNYPLPANKSGKLPSWAWIGCAILIVVITLMVIVALTTGILIGQGLGGG